MSDRLFLRTINSFIKEHKDILDTIYELYFKEYTSKKEFYIFAYKNTTINEELSRIYRQYS